MSALFALLNVNNWGTKISIKLVFVLCVGWMSFLCGELFVKKLIYHNKWQCNEEHELKEIRFQPIILYFVIAINLLITFMLYREVSSIARIGGSNTGIIANYKQNSLDYSLSGTVTQAMKITKAYAFICGYIFCNNICARQYTRKKMLKQIWLLVPGVIYCIQCIMKGGRFNVIAFVIAILFYLYFALQYKSNWRYRIQLKNLAKVVIAAMLIIYLFWFYKEFVGRTSEASLFDYISQYIGGPYELFNQFIQDGSKNMGNETFAGMVTSINKIFGTNLKNLSYHEFRFTSTGIMLGNAYSGIRNYYSDFGVIGVVLMCFNLSVTFNSIYCHLSKSSNIYMHCFGLILYGSLIYCIVFHFFTDYFFARLSVGWFIEVLIMYICFYMMTKVRFKFGK